MFFVIKEKVLIEGQLVAGYEVDRLVETLDEVESGEYFVKCNVKG